MHDKTHLEKLEAHIRSCRSAHAPIRVAAHFVKVDVVRTGLHAAERSGVLSGVGLGGFTEAVSPPHFTTNRAARGKNTLVVRDVHLFQMSPTVFNPKRDL